MTLCHSFLIAFVIPPTDPLLVFHSSPLPSFVLRPRMDRDLVGWRTRATSSQRSSDDVQRTRWRTTRAGEVKEVVVVVVVEERVVENPRILSEQVEL